MVHAAHGQLANRSPGETRSAEHAQDSLDNNGLFDLPNEALCINVRAESTTSRSRVRRDEAPSTQSPKSNGAENLSIHKLGQTSSKNGRQLKPRHDRKNAHHQTETVKSVAAVAHDDGTQNIQRLDEVILASLVSSAGDNGTQFLPKDKLKDIVSMGNVKQELDLYVPNTENANTAKKVCEGKPARRKIFAILCLMNKTPEILSFIQENVTDDDLPLAFGTHYKSKIYRRSRNGPTNKHSNAISLFEKTSWKFIDRDNFKRLQWQFLAPYFSLKFDRGQTSRHWKLETSRILPFIEDVPNIEDAPNTAIALASEAREGGFSFVRKVMIHPAHHNRTSKDQTSYFAVKELKKRPEQGLKEIQALLRFNDQPHDHLIRLLAIYEHRDRLNMIFPWADGGHLEQFWETNSSMPRQDHGFVKWMSKQILGLASALRSIHHPNVRALPIGDHEKTHGRHGDIKPTNILWFKSHGLSESMGVLKISDFGFADFHAERSKSNVRRSDVLGLTDIYRAPEFDVRKVVSPRYDIWSFGCVLLEIVVWYLLGYDDGVMRFTESRAQDSTAVIREDNFFNFHTEPKRGIVAQMKPSVNKMFQDLRNHDACTDYISELLHVIQVQLLQVLPKDRARCDVIEDKFRALDEKCMLQAQYCTPRRRLHWRHIVSSEPKLVSLSLSPEMTEENLNSIAQGQEECARHLPAWISQCHGIAWIWKEIMLALFLILGCNAYEFCKDFFKES